VTHRSRLERVSQDIEYVHKLFLCNKVDSLQERQEALNSTRCCKPFSHRQ
jgi:hypothetical protein